MRQSAQQLDERQQKIAEELKQAVEPEQKSLRDDGVREKLAEELSSQRERLGELQNQMRDTIQRAESSEPLLSERLYETARNAQDRKLDQVLETAEQAVRQGYDRESKQLEEMANAGIRQMREGIEQAAESVLGDETEALRRAREELQNLADELNQEIRRNLPDAQQASAASQQNAEVAGQSQEDDPSNSGRPSGSRTTEGESPSRPAGEGSIGGSSRPAGERSAQRGANGQQQSQSGEQSLENQQGATRERGGENDQQGSRRAQQPGETKSGEQPSGENQAGGQQQPAQQSGEQQGGQQQQSGQPGEQQQGGQPQRNGQQQSSPQQPGGQPQAGGPQTGRERTSPRQPGRLGGSPISGETQPGNPQAGTSGFREDGANRQFAPITGEDFRQWSDRLRDVEEMVADPELRAEAARIRERARAMRAEFKRHSKEPQWDLIDADVAKPLVELQDRVAEELLRRASKKAIVPLDRDPVPPQYSEKTRRYYEQLGSGK